MNVLFISKLNSELIHFTQYALKPHDQKQWNEMNLRDLFEIKDFGILGDGGFTFNRMFDFIDIHGYKPILKPKGGKLILDQKSYNKSLSQMQAVIENAIRKVKRWKVLSHTFRHWRSNMGKLDLNKIVCIGATLSNRQIICKPLQKDDWMAPEWRGQLASTVP